MVGSGQMGQDRNKATAERLPQCRERQRGTEFDSVGGPSLGQGCFAANEVSAELKGVQCSYEVLLLASVQRPCRYRGREASGAGGRAGARTARFCAAPAAAPHKSGPPDS